MKKQAGYTIHRTWMRRIVVMTLLLLMAWLSFPGGVRAANMKIKGKLVNQTSYKITWSGTKEYRYWRIRRAIIKKNGEQSPYKTIKVLKRANRSFTIKKLKKDRQYVFEITGGIKKKGKYKPLMYDYFWNVYTGLSRAEWQDYASSDAPCSPTYIDLWGYCQSDGLPVKGFQIYRRKKGEKKFKKIATINKKGFPYRDKKVEKGVTYQYRIRTYGTYKKKRIYSPYSSVLTRSAINQNGKFLSEKISCTKDELVVKLESVPYNAALTLRADSLCFPGEEDEGIALVIKGYSYDNKTWKILSQEGKLILPAGKTVYLRLTSVNGNQDMTSGKSLYGDYVIYENLPCFFGIEIGGEGSATHNNEFIH